MTVAAPVTSSCCRWLNGAFFSFVHYAIHFGRILRGGHSLPRKAALAVQFVYMLLNAMLSFFTLGTLFLSFMLIFDQVITFAPFGAREFRLLFIFGYSSLLFVQIMTGLAGETHRRCSCAGTSTPCFTRERDAPLASVDSRAALQARSTRCRPCTSLSSSCTQSS